MTRLEGGKSKSASVLPVRKAGLLKHSRSDLWRKTRSFVDEQVIIPVLAVFRCTKRTLPNVALQLCGHEPRRNRRNVLNVPNKGFRNSVQGLRTRCVREWS